LNPVAKLCAWIDESGAKGLSSRLTTTTKDDEFALFATILVRASEKAAFKAALRPAFEDFKAHAPAGAKLHITDAFAKDGTGGFMHLKWMESACRARTAIFEQLHRLGPCVAYGARRSRLSRLMYSLQQDAEIMANERVRAVWPHINVKFAPQSSARVDTDALKDLMLIINLVAYDWGAEPVEMRLDRVDEQLRRVYEEALDAVRRDAVMSVTVRARDSRTGEHRKVSDAHEFNRLGAVLDTQAPRAAITTIAIERGEEPELFAVDVLVNDLRHHLADRPGESNLYGVAATANWPHKALLLHVNESNSCFFGTL
jgi:hypothetical protein